MTLYSHNGKYPAPLPHRITLPDGSTRTDRSTFTSEEIASAGYVEAPPKPSITQFQSLNWKNGVWEILPAPLDKLRGFRNTEVSQLKVTVDGYTFDADEDSMNRLDRVIDIANWRYNQGIAQSMPPALVYKQVYQETKIPWKTSDNQFLEFSVETLCKAQEAALHQLAGVWLKYG